MRNILEVNLFDGSSLSLQEKIKIADKSEDYRYLAGVKIMFDLVPVIAAGFIFVKFPFAL